MEQRQQDLDREADRHHRPGDLDDPLGPRDDPHDVERDDPLDLGRDPLADEEEPLDRRDPLADEPGAPVGSDARPRDDDDDEAAARRWEELTDRHERPAGQDDAGRAREAGGEPADERLGAGDERLGAGMDERPHERTDDDAHHNGEDEDLASERTEVLAPDGSEARPGEGWPERADEELERPIEAPAAAPVQQPAAASVDQDLAAEPAVVHSPGSASTGPAVAPPVAGTGDQAVGVATPATSPGGADGREALVRPDEAGDFTRRWEDAQAEFLDSPRRAVERAHELVGELLDHVRARLDEQRAGLHGRWSGDTEADTENLRVTMQGYRELFRRLLSG